MLHECRACPRRKNRKTNTSLGIPHTFSFPLLPAHECRAVNLHMMTLTILFHMDVKWGSRPLTGQGRDGIQVYENAVSGLRSGDRSSARIELRTSLVPKDHSRCSAFLSRLC